MIAQEYPAVLNSINTNSRQIFKEFLTLLRKLKLATFSPIYVTKIISEQFF